VHDPRSQAAHRRDDHRRDRHRHERVPHRRAPRLMGGTLPGHNESAGKRRSGRTRKGSKWLRTGLLESALAAVRTKDSYLTAQYPRLKARRGHGRAAIAICHSILAACWPNGTMIAGAGSHDGCPTCAGGSSGSGSSASKN
jgi:hypothetical protein